MAERKLMSEAEAIERFVADGDSVYEAHPAERLACLAFEHLDKVIGTNREMLERNRGLWNAFAVSRGDLECMPAEHGITTFPRWGGGNTDRLDMTRP